jgi:hypothetical protein
VELRAKGINTRMVKKVRVRAYTDEKGGTTVTREVELFDRSGEEFDRIADRTEGKPTQALQVSGELPTAVRIITPLTAHLMGRQDGSN